MSKPVFVVIYYLLLIFRSLFEQLDVKKDGKIDAEELTTGLFSMGYTHLSQVNIAYHKSE